MELQSNGPVQGPRAPQPELPKTELLRQVRARTASAREDLERYREQLAQRQRVQRDRIELRAERADERAASERTSESEERASRDRIELSERARVLASGGARRVANANAAEHEAMDARIAALRQSLEDGSLHSPERLERAARRLLGDES